MPKAQTTSQASQKERQMYLAKKDGDPISESISIPSEDQSVDGLDARITARVYELYAERGYREGYAGQDWLDAEREILNRISQS